MQTENRIRVSSQTGRTPRVGTLAVDDNIKNPAIRKGLAMNDLPCLGVRELVHEHRGRVEGLINLRAGVEKVGLILACRGKATVEFSHAGKAMDIVVLLHEAKR